MADDRSDHPGGEELVRRELITREELESARETAAQSGVPWYRALVQARRIAATEAAATLGFSSAVAAFGGFFIPIAYGASFDLSGGPGGALLFLSLFYLVCLGLTWHGYARKGAALPC